MASGGKGQWGDEQWSQAQWAEWLEWDDGDWAQWRRAEEARKTEEARKAAADGAPSGSRPGAGGTGPGTAIAGRVETAVGESDGEKAWDVGFLRR